MHSFILYQLPVDGAVSAFLDYGIIGSVVILLAFVAHKFYSKIDDNAQEWKKEAKDMRHKYYELFMMMRDSSEKLIEIRERDVKERRLHEIHLEKKMDDLPETVVKEIQFARLHKRNEVNVTPS